MKKSTLCFLALLLSTACLANGEVTFLRAKGNVTKITVRSRLLLHTQTNDLPSLQLLSINESLDLFLNQPHSYTDSSGEKFQLTFAVRAYKASDITTTALSDNEIELNQTGQDFASPKGLTLTNYRPALDQADVTIRVGNQASISYQAILPYSTTLTHETLHLFGLDDRYHNFSLANGSALSLEDDGFDWDIMSCNKGAFNPLHVAAFVNLVKAARAEGRTQFLLHEVTNLNVGHISEKPQYLKLASDLSAETN